MHEEARDLPPHLKAISPELLSIGRRKRGKGWTYFYCRDGRSVRDESRLKRLAGIPVPATWTDVRLAVDPKAYIQATGYDGSGKLQYLYHEDYLAYRNQRKFDELPHFGACLPRLRRRIARDLRAEDWTQTRLTALLVRILDRYHLRVGSRVYATRNRTFGLTTLRKKHLREDENDISFEYRAKGGKQRTVQLTDPNLVQLVREVAELPGWELFSFRRGGEEVCADARRVNEYIRSISGENFTARTFRTWGGTVLAVRSVTAARREVRENPRRQLQAALVERVAKKLGNSPAICREYYIHPDVLEASLADGFDPEPSDPRFLNCRLYRKHECRTLEILSEE